MTAKVRITVLVENRAHGARLLGEHGLAYWIECSGKRVLLDTGQGHTMAVNATALGIAPREADAIVLSHGHYDHTGGLCEVLRDEGPATIYLHPAALRPKYARSDDGTSRAIGIPDHCKQALNRDGVRVVPTEGPTTVVEGLTVTGAVPRATDFEDVGGPFFLDPACQEPDPLEDDQSLFFETAGGTVVLLGCAHSGLINTLERVRRLTDDRPILAVIGGMHLVGASTERIDRTIEALRRFSPQFLAPCHCTGMAATAALWNAFPGRCLECRAGSRFELAVK